MKLIAFLIAPLAVMAGCGGPEPPSRFTGPPDDDLVVAIWSESPGWLTSDLAALACNIWAPEGVHCMPADSRDHADAFVATDASDCRHVDSGLAIGARSVVAERRVIVFEDCISMAERRDGTLMLHLLGHEFGHLLGILKDVPTTCTGNEDTLDGLRGGSICGSALMNSVADSLFAWMTVIDDRAFRARDHRWSIGHPSAQLTAIQAPTADCEFLIPNADR